MKEDKSKDQGTMDDSVPVFGTWNNWYIGIVICNILFISIITYIFSNI